MFTNTTLRPGNWRFVAVLVTTEKLGASLPYGDRAADSKREPV